MDGQPGVYNVTGNSTISKVQQPCTEESQFIQLYDRIIRLNKIEEDGKVGRRLLLPRVSVRGTVIETPMNKLPVKVSKNLEQFEPDDEVLDLTVTKTEKPANIPNLTIFESREPEEKEKLQDVPPRLPVDIAEPYVDIRPRDEPTSSKICQEVSNDIGINLRVGCDPLKEFPGLTLTPWPEDQSYYYDTTKLYSKPKKTASSTFQKGLVTYGNSSALTHLMNQHKLLVTGTHGVITNESLNPSQIGKYNGGYPGEFEVTMSLGEGGFGKVQLCVDRKSQKQFVRKEIFGGFKKNEVLLLQQINHQNITKLFGFIQRNGTQEILMEYAGTNLLKFTITLGTCQLLNDELIWNFTKQGLSAFEYLDIRGILHLDVKPENFCVIEISGEYVMKLTDFGSAKTPQDPLTYQGWTAEYMSPEACLSFLNNRFPQKFQDNPTFQMTGKTDIFSFALTVLFMYCKTHVLMKFFTNGQTYRDVDRKQTQLQIILALSNRPDIVQELMLPDNCSPQMKELLKDLLQGCPSYRPSACEALNKMQKIKALEKLPLKVDTEDIFDEVIRSKKTKAKRVKRCRKSSTRESQNSRYSTESMLVSSGSIMNSFRISDEGYNNLGSPGSPGSPMSPESPGGPLRCRSLKTKLRQRLSCPYGSSQKVNNTVSIIVIPSNSDDIDGNVPNFSMLG